MKHRNKISLLKAKRRSQKEKTISQGFLIATRSCEFDPVGWVVCQSFRERPNGLQLGQQSLAFIFQLLFRYSECFWLLDGLFECKHVGWDSESASIGDCKILQPKGDGDGGGDIDFQLPLDAGRKAIILKCGLSSGWRSFKIFSAWSSRGARSGAYLCSCTRQSHLKSSYAPQLQSSFKKGPGRHGLFLQNQWDETAIVRTRLGH